MCDNINQDKRDMEKDSELVKQKLNFNGGYIKASQEAYDLFVMDIDLNTKSIRVKTSGYYYIINNIVLWVDKINCITILLIQFYINDGTLSWDEPSTQEEAKIVHDFKCECGAESSKFIAPACTPLVDETDEEAIAEHNKTCPMYINSMEDLNELPIVGERETKTISIADEFAINVRKITDALAELLISKNAKYGNSALEPKRIFSKASAVEQILVRLDDKLSRMANQSDLEDEDIVEDLLGYLVLLKIAKNDID